MSQKKSVLIICYNFPPIGGGGVPRPLKMAKYLGEFGWRVHILTVDPTYHVTSDPSLLAQLPASVTIHRAKEKNFLPRPNVQQTSKPQGEASTVPAKPSAVSQVKRGVINLLKKVKPYLLIPDDQILWYPEAVKKGREIMHREQIDVIFSTSGPVTNHLIGQKLAQEFPCKWVIDFRDPWTQNMHRSGIAWRDRLEERMEAKVMKAADAVTTVTATFAKNFRKKYGDTIKRLELIYNGFDREDFVNLEPYLEQPDKFHAVYAGILYQKRNPRLLLAAIKELIDEGLVDRSQIALSFAGVFDYPGYTENADCVRELGLGDVVHVLGNLKHKEALGLMKGGDALLLIGDVTPDAGAYIPGKLYEYMGIGNPVLALNMPGEATEIIQEFRLGQVANPLDKEAIKQAYLKLYQEWKAGKQVDEQSGPQKEAEFADRVKPYERKEQARQLAQLMDELMN
ncbi:glycosyltransferase family 4 protein [Brevibacillus ginsengisoli]|uniref:glycosyltransferase family 4 protein n=1 Tax=Brevibacillus ginsengisoli TaxID=363854 RepID=UPI003CF3890C